MLTRTMVIWCPDWPVRAVIHLEGMPPTAPVAVFAKSKVFACSASARAEGVCRGMRMRDAQARCPELCVFDYDETLDARAFEPVLEAVEVLSPGVQLIRPGTCAVRAKGPSRFYGGERQAAAVLAERLVALGVDDCRIGVADGPFAAEQAARRAEQQDSFVIDKDGSAAFLHDIPIGVLDRPELVSLLLRLGLRTLGALAALAARDVVTRFGDEGAWAHRMATGRDERAVVARRAPPELVRHADFEPPLEQVDPIAFSMRSTAEAFVSALAHEGLVCTAVRVEVRTDDGCESGRTWLHPRWFDPHDLIDRIRWQLQGSPGPASGASAPVSQVRLVPEEVDLLGNHADGLWGGAPDERIHRALSRVQGMVGHEGVISAVLGGGRGTAERQTAVPWGDQLVPAKAPELPWPGSLPAPAPSTVYADPRPAVVVGVGGQPVGVTGRGVLTTEPARFCPTGGDELQPVQAWAGPWPVDERWWDPEQSRRYARFQMVGVDGSAWLLAVENGTWWTEARYD